MRTPARAPPDGSASAWPASMRTYGLRFVRGYWLPLGKRGLSATCGRKVTEYQARKLGFAAAWCEVDSLSGFILPTDLDAPTPMLNSKWIISIVAALGMIFGIGAASAADLPRKAVPMPTPAWTWSGWYVGGNVGWGFGESSGTNLSVVNPGNAGNIGAFLGAGLPGGFSSGNLYPSLQPSGVAGGMQAGYDRQFNNVVLGVVADIQAAGFYASATKNTSLVLTGVNVTETLTAKVDWFGTVRGKVGYSFGNWMAYGTGGLAYGDVSSQLEFFCTPGGVGCGGINFGGRNSEMKTGWAAGAGVAMKLTDSVNVGVEYLHIDLGRSSVTAVDLGCPRVSPRPRSLPANASPPTWSGLRSTTNGAVRPSRNTKSPARAKAPGCPGLLDAPTGAVPTVPQARASPPAS